MAGFKILGIDHLGLVPKVMDKASQFFTEVLQLPMLGHDIVAEQKVEVDMVGCQNQSSEKSGPRLELLVPLNEHSPIQGFLEKRGGGIHHIALRVDNIKAALAHLQKSGVRLIDENPRMGAHGSLIAFVHPEASGGILVELVEHKK